MSLVSPEASARVCAVTTPGALDAVTRQTLTPDDIVVGVCDPAALLAREASWFWFVEDAVVPEASALETLVRALDDLGPLADAALLASKVVTPGGRLAPAWLPVVLTRDPPLNVAAYERHLVRVRIVRRGSLLVHRSTLATHGLPARDDILWSARVLRSAPGLLVPASVVVAGDDGPAPLELLEWCRLLLSSALMRMEKPWFLFWLLEAALERAGSVSADRS